MQINFLTYNGGMIMAEENVELQKLKFLVEKWARYIAGVSNRDKSRKDQVDFDKIKINFVKQEAKGSKKAFLSIVEKATKPIKQGSPRGEERELIESISIQYPDEGVTEFKRTLSKEKTFATEKISEHTDALSLGLGASVYGVDLSVGYDASWTASNTTTNTSTKGSSEEIVIPIVVPPGGATYTFSTYRVPMVQNYKFEAKLHGEIYVYFGNNNKVKYSLSTSSEPQKFYRTDHHPKQKNRCRIPIAEVFKGLEEMEAYKNHLHYSTTDPKTVVYFATFSVPLKVIRGEIETNAVFAKPDKNISKTEKPKKTEDDHNKPRVEEKIPRKRKERRSSKSKRRRKAKQEKESSNAKENTPSNVPQPNITGTTPDILERLGQPQTTLDTSTIGVQIDPGSLSYLSKEMRDATVARIGSQEGTGTDKVLDQLLEQKDKLIQQYKNEEIPEIKDMHLDDIKMTRQLITDRVHHVRAENPNLELAAKYSASVTIIDREIDLLIAESHTSSGPTNK